MTYSELELLSNEVLELIRRNDTMGMLYDIKEDEFKQFLLIYKPNGKMFKLKPSPIDSTTILLSVNSPSHATDTLYEQLGEFGTPTDIAYQLLIR